MAGKSRLTRLDAFTKTVEDARIRTTSGGIVTIASIITVIFLLISEWRDYRKITIRPELVVDKTRGEKLEIHMNITFPKVPCELLTLDVMDVSGDLQSSVAHGIQKHRLSKDGHYIASQDVDLHNEDHGKHLAPDYCGNCYGAPAPENAVKSSCCNSCDEVREAYAGVGWAFGDGTGVEQCEREGYGKRLEEQREEGCNIDGLLQVNKVIGNFHFAPGKSFSNAQMHVHDLNNYFQSHVEHSFEHTIHKLSFGEMLPYNDKIHYNTYYNPLDGIAHHTNEKAHNFMYFLKIVSTEYRGIGEPPQKTHQFSVTSHERSLMGGAEQKPGHEKTIHARGGIPGVFFSYDISPMKVINWEEREKSFFAFLTGIFAIVGGTLTVAAAADRAMYEGAVRIKKFHKR